MERRLKDKKIVVYQPVTRIGDNGGQREDWIPIHPGRLWAYVRQLSQKERYTQGIERREEDTLFVVNWRSDINQGNAILYKERWYDVVRVDVFEGYKEDLQVFGQARMDGKAPDELPQAV